MKIGVVLSTYNAPERLESTLIGYAAQTRRDFELIVADDGSTDETRALIEATALRFAMPVRHVWQEDLGFRKCRILNQAILGADSDYLIFSDGDCIPRADFVATHAALARPGRFLSGGYFKLDRATSLRISPHDILSGRATDPDWLIAQGMKRSLKLSKLQARGWVASALNLLTPTRPTWNGHNASGWRSDMLRVNGFDERMAYWAQDREFGERLVNAGVDGTQIRYAAICVHLHHDRPYKTDESRARNREIRRATKRDQAVWTAHGIIDRPHPVQRHAAAPTLAPDIAIRTYLAA